MSVWRFVWCVGVRYLSEVLVLRYLRKVPRCVCGTMCSKWFIRVRVLLRLFVRLMVPYLENIKTHI